MKLPEISPHPAYAPAVLTLGLCASLGGALVFLKLADEILEHETLSIDTNLVHEFREMRSPALDKLMTAATTFGEPWALASISSLVTLRWASQHRKADIATGALGLAGSSILNLILKSIFRRKRPALHLRRAHASGYSFPSGHAMTTLATYATFAYLTGRHALLTNRPSLIPTSIPVTLLCIAVGASRVYLEVHYPTDVLAGWAAATIWLSTCAVARNFMEPEES